MSHVAHKFSGFFLAKIQKVYFQLRRKHSLIFVVIYFSLQRLTISYSREIQVGIKKKNSLTNN